MDGHWPFTLRGTKGAVKRPWNMEVKTNEKFKTQNSKLWKKEFKILTNKKILNFAFYILIFEFIKEGEHI